MFCGWALSSYASNFIFRLPRKEYTFGREPYCGDCNASLTPRDLAPIISYYMTDGKCRHCGSQVPFSYFIVEILFPLGFLAAYVQFSFGDAFMLVTAAYSCAVIIAMMAWEDDYYSPLTTTFLGIVGLWMQTLQTHGILGGILSAFLGFMIAASWHLKGRDLKKETPDIRTFPSYIWLATVLGCWLPFLPLFISLAFWYVITKLLTPLLTKTVHSAKAGEAIAFSITLITAIFVVY
jgi:prepilin signal peptidase PulO-like enzyme (type II secretory pathway)